MQANIWELVLEHLKEHRKEVGNSPEHLVSTTYLKGLENPYSSFPRIGASPLI